MSKKQYVRDKRSPIPLNENISKVMSANKANNTTPEILLRKELYSNGIRGYRLNWEKAPGKPDIAFPGKKIAIFVHGCYWHRCPTCDLPTPKTNTEFWNKKFESNIARDFNKEKELINFGWSTVTIWECKLKENCSKYVNKIIKLLNEKEN